MLMHLLTLMSHNPCHESRALMYSTLIRLYTHLSLGQCMVVANPAQQHEGLAVGLSPAPKNEIKANPRVRPAYFFSVRLKFN